jgi:hypothetical protein
MAWETRNNGRRYYTRSTRVNGKVVREYVGTGYLAELAAQIDNCERYRKELEKADIDAIRGELDSIEAAISGYDERIKRIVNATLTAAGYHRHDRGLWRRKRAAMPIAKTETTQELAIPDNVGDQWAAVKAGVHAPAGSKAESLAITCIEKLGANQEKYDNFTQPLFELMYQGKANKANLMIRQQIFNQACTDLAGHNATPLEKLLVERIMISQEQLSLCETLYAEKSKQSISLPLATYHQKSIAMAQKRYLDAIKALAQIRKLQLPATIQVNIADKQVNIAAE